MIKDTSDRKGNEFPYLPGESFKRSDLHELFGGSFQQGMTSANEKSDFLIFHDEVNNQEFGYDIWQGFQADGSFHYTGQGIKGDQKMSRSNLALLRANDQMLPIHLIESSKGLCTYIGRFALGEPPYFEKLAPDIQGGNLRKVFVFNLIPLSTSLKINSDSPSSAEVTGEDHTWAPPSFAPIEKGVIRSEKSVIDLIEHKLQSEFGQYLIAQGHTPLNHTFQILNSKGFLKPDFWVPDLKLVIEAKPSSAREYVRLAIGQVLDYANLARLEGVSISPAILLPNMPAKDLVTLLSSLEITLIVKSGIGFEFIHPS